VRIVFLNPAGAIGGAERALIDIIASLQKARPAWQLSLIAAADGDLVREAQELGAQTSVVAFPGSLAVLGDAGTIDDAGGSKRSIALAGRLAMAALTVQRARQVLPPYGIREGCAEAWRSLAPLLPDG